MYFTCIICNHCPSWSDTRYLVHFFPYATNMPPHRITFSTSEFLFVRRINQEILLVSLPPSPSCNKIFYVTHASQQVSTYLSDHNYSTYSFHWNDQVATCSSGTIYIRFYDNGDSVCCHLFKGRGRWLQGTANGVKILQICSYIFQSCSNYWNYIGLLAL